MSTSITRYIYRDLSRSMDVMQILPINVPCKETIVVNSQSTLSRQQNIPSLKLVILMQDRMVAKDTLRRTR